MKVLVLGSGQLAQMMYLASVPLGIDLMAVDVSTNKVVHPVSKQAYDFDLEFAMSDVNVITAEFEHIPEILLAKVEESGKFLPNIESIMAGADRVREKALLESLNIANCQHLVIDDVSQVDNVIPTLGDEVIFKASRDGYDGYGQWRLRQANDIEDLKQKFANLDLSSVPLVVEKLSHFNREISVVGARDSNGNIRCFDIAENAHYEGQLHVSIAPATHLSESVKTKAENIFKTIADGLDYVGVLAVELFQVSDSLLVNEIAPRVHNSGHWTQQGADTCQFEQHIRAVLGFPLGSTESKGVTAMINIIGCTTFSRNLVGIEGCHLHWYGKTHREKRKMGHINVVADCYHSLGEKLLVLSEFLPEESFPLLKQQAEYLISR